ncbi:MAG: SAM-dependent chlorinase/fluorinase [Actinomycetota bacterium]
MRPIVFCTDYGLGDEFVGVCHGVMQRIAPGVPVIDLTHAIARQDVLQGALVLGRAAAYMPADAVYVGVVDPGVGGERAEIAVESGSGAFLVGPDNGLLSMAWSALGGAARAVSIVSPAVMLRPVSRTFHGRDVFAPAGAHLANGVVLEELGPPLEVGELATLELPGPMVAPGKIGARVMGVDGFGNVQLNLGPAELDHAGLGEGLVVAGRPAPLVGVFSDVAEQAMATIIDSQGFLAVVVNQGSAAAVLGLRPGATVMVEGS